MQIIDSFTGTHSFLSNFSHSVITDEEGIVYPTVEHAFAAAKTFDLDTRKNIAQTYSPNEAKRLGRSVDLRGDWESVKTNVMHGFLVQKFSSETLADKLCSTGNAVLIEGNTWHDQYWGNCICPRHNSIDGQNTLGILLMSIRLTMK